MSSRADELAAFVSRPVERHRPQFTGNTREYFGIWFVNLLLSIVTLGIYSAWAKVRTERYFYGHTRLAGASFEYLANPIAILKGRLVAYSVVIALGLSSRFSPRLYLGLLLAVYLVMPVIVVLGLRFRARNSAWRGLRFRFDRRIGEAVKPFLLWPILNIITVTLLYPSMKMRQQRFAIEGHRFGRAKFRFAGDSGDYFRAYWAAVGLWFLGTFALTFLVTMIFTSIHEESGIRQAMYVYIVLAYALIASLFVYVRVRYTNLFWQNAKLEDHRFESTLGYRAMLWIYASNLVAIVCTIGLALPWAMIRLARYRAANFAVLTRGSIDDFVADVGADINATGAELSDALDFGGDFGFA